MCACARSRRARQIRMAPDPVTAIVTRANTEASTAASSSTSTPPAKLSVVLSPAHGIMQHEDGCLTRHSHVHI